MPNKSEQAVSNLQRFVGDDEREGIKIYPMRDGIRRGAWFSPHNTHRLLLWRMWDGKLPMINWVMLNPSKADHIHDDATLRRCIGFSKPSFGGLIVTNLYSYIATRPTDLRKAEYPVLDVDDAILDLAALQARAIVVGWGALPSDRSAGRAIGVLNRLCRYRTLHCLGETKTGHPRHPVRLPNAQPFEVYRWRGQRYPREGESNASR